MRKLTWLGSILLTLTACMTSASHAQNVRYEYAGPLDGLQTVPLSDVITPKPAQRVASLNPAKKLRPAHPSVSGVAVGRITGAYALPPSRQTSRATGQAFSSPRPTQAIRETFPRDVPPPAFAGPLTEATGQTVERNVSTQPGYSGALTNPRTWPAETNYAPRQRNPAQPGSSSRTHTAPRTAPPATTYVPRQQNSAQPGYSGALTTPRSVLNEPNAFPRQNDTTQFGALRSLTAPRTAPAETNFTPRQAQPTQFGYTEPDTAPRNRSVETDYIPPQDESPQNGYAGALTAPGGYQTEAGYIPAQEDPTRFGYRDGEAFGFNNTRLYNPLESPGLDLQGAPTVALGEPGCDEWQNFGRGRDLDLSSPCGGMKANPGHLGIPWLGSKEPCDQTIPFRERRRLGDRRKQADEACETCGSCPTCGR